MVILSLSRVNGTIERGNSAKILVKILKNTSEFAKILADLPSTLATLTLHSVDVTKNSKKKLKDMP